MGGHLFTHHSTNLHSLLLRRREMGKDNWTLDPLHRLSPKRFQNLTSLQKTATTADVHVLPLMWCGSLEKGDASSSSDRGSNLRGSSQNRPRVASKRDENITELIR
ncbi:hypothetical protein AVEN_213242-1 [Araneus ventricosus]|uniref:Uncharacterized protein n=1 Tax=Araneus ventricosus TaxID=182803 RepID=A0A4Y2B6D0_ARAVE|nr:hypothetical protein AVEN_227258-1 [Araneus ventricosus]GBL87496.1 hypothetical protein AVEN_14179-1 [Araneus ventricosus]GBL87508.1 hypothetical protein AVEN_126620-1 [Araneus ventricosus]GBL87558.1 hypothetical protein AVEN_213242-1 [Araneus ventricosus]